MTVAPVERRTVDRTVEVVGTLKGWEDVTLGSKRVGRVVKTYHDMGDRVDPGALLVELETVDADLAVMQAERQLQAELAKLGLKEIPKTVFDVTTVPSVVQARVTLERARQNLGRERSLIQRGAGTSQDFQNAENDEKAAAAGLENAILTARAILANAQASQVALDVARQARLDMEIRAPVPSATPARRDRADQVRHLQAMRSPKGRCSGRAIRSSTWWSRTRSGSGRTSPSGTARRSSSTSRSGSPSRRTRERPSRGRSRGSTPRSIR